MKREKFFFCFFSKENFRKFQKKIFGRKIKKIKNLKKIKLQLF